MRKFGLYITAAMMATGMMMWGTPMASHAELIVAEANENGDFKAGDVEENEAEDSPVLVAAANTQDNTVDDGPDLAIQSRRKAAEEEAKAAAQRAAEAEAVASKREKVVNYALQFLNGPYRDGGSDPRTGTDCSGFVKYVMQNGAGVTMNRSSVAQATQGVPVSASQMQPGDLIFYGNGSRINHVAMYIGDGQIVHASTYKTGIKISNWNYRAPVKIMNVLG